MRVLNTFGDLERALYLQSDGFLYAVSGQVPWSHWHAISTSSDPASLQTGPQYLSPAWARHRHGMCAHLFCSFVVIVILLIDTSRLPPARSLSGQYRTSRFGKLVRIDRVLVTASGRQCGWAEAPSGPPRFTYCSHSLDLSLTTAARYCLGPVREATGAVPNWRPF